MRTAAHFAEKGSPPCLRMSVFRKTGSYFCRTCVRADAWLTGRRGVMLTREDSVERDRNDPLGAARDRFVLPEGVNYLDGNSLGCRPKGVAERVARMIE